MKKLLCFCVSFMMMLLLCTGCGQSQDVAENTSVTDENANVTEETTEEIATEETTEEITTEAVEQVSVLSGFTYEFAGSKEEYTVGKNATLNEEGLLESAKRSCEYTCEYNSDGCITKATSNYLVDKSGKILTVNWEYENNVPVSRSYDPGWRIGYSKSTTYESVGDEKIKELVEHTTYTDDTGSVNNDTSRFIYEYDADGKVSSFKRMMDDGKMDYNMKITYDEDGNITQMSAYSESNQLLLEYNMTYEKVDASSVKESNISDFNKVLNWQNMLMALL